MVTVQFYLAHSINFFPLSIKRLIYRHSEIKEYMMHSCYATHATSTLMYNLNVNEYKIGRK